jgi:hypothetical protein
MTAASRSLALCILLAIQSLNKVYGDEYLFTVVDRIELTDANPIEAISTITEAAHDAGAGKLGFVGVSVEVDPSKNRETPRITMNLKDVPLGVALDYVAGFFQGHILANSNGIVIISNSESKQHEVLELSPKIRVAFGLPEKPTSNEIRQALIAAKFKLDSNDEIIVAPSGEYARIVLRVEEAKNLEALIELLERGLSLR